jgi:hypothetical protein
MKKAAHILAAGLAAAAFVTLSPVQPDRLDSAATAAASCTKPGAIVGERICRIDREGRLRWRRYAKPTPAQGPVVTSGMPFAPTLPAGLSAKDVAISFTKDWNSYEACLDWGPEHNNEGSYRTGPITARCNKAVWGVPNAWREWQEERMSDVEYYRPLSVLWEKYTSYGVTLLHSWCSSGRYIDNTCTGLPTGWPGFRDGHQFDSHLPYENVTLIYADETWDVFLTWGLEDFTSIREQATGKPGDPWWDDKFGADLRRAWEGVPIDPAFGEVPGCRILPNAEYQRSCNVRVAYRRLFS